MVNTLERLCWGVVTLLGCLWVAAWTPLRDLNIIAMLVAPDRLMAGVAVAIALVAVSQVRSSERRTALVYLLIASLAVGALFAGRVVAQGAGGVSGEQHAQPRFVMVSWNAQGIPPDIIADRLIDVVRTRNVDVIVLPETGGTVAEMVFDRLRAVGWNSVGFTTDEATSVVMRSDLAAQGGYAVQSGNPPWAGMTVAPTGPSAATPIIVATHVQQPSPGNLSVRAQHLSWVESLCNQDYVIAVGDFNSTLNNLQGARIGRCVDIGAVTGAGAASTWPTWLPSWLGISIDRGMVGPPLRPQDGAVEVLRDVDTTGVEGWGSGRGADHWPILVTLS